MPKILVSLNADLKRVFFLTDGNSPKTSTVERLDDRNRLAEGEPEGNEALTQAWGWAINHAGYDAALVPSAVAGGENLLVFPENLGHGRIQLDNEVVWPES